MINNEFYELVNQSNMDIDIDERLKMNLFHKFYIDVGKNRFIL
jgi:hypothetical protein